MHVDGWGGVQPFTVATRLPFDVHAPSKGMEAGVAPRVDTGVINVLSLPLSFLSGS